MYTHTSPDRPASLLVSRLLRVPAFHPPPPPTLPSPAPCLACGVAPTAELRRSPSRPPWALSLLRYLPSLLSVASPLFPLLALHWALHFYFMIDADGPTRSVDVLQARAQDLPELRRARATRLLRQRYLPPHHQSLSWVSYFVLTDLSLLVVNIWYWLRNEWLLFLLLLRISLCKVGILQEPAEVASPSMGEQSVDHSPPPLDLSWINDYVVPIVNWMLAAVTVDVYPGFNWV